MNYLYFNCFLPVSQQKCEKEMHYFCSAAYRRYIKIVRIIFGSKLRFEVV